MKKGMSLLVAAALAASVDPRLMASGISVGPKLRNIPPPPDPKAYALKREIAEHNAAVDAKKADKRARQMANKETE